LEPAKGRCKVVIPRHPVPKGPTDIRVVWNCTKNGVNITIVVPSFSLPTKATLCRKVVNGTHMEDFDIGEQFHNYLLRLCESAFHGVVIPSDLVKTMKEAEPLMRWTRLPFGWSPSPVFALRMLARAIELAKRHPSDSTSAFQWSEVVLNIPASPDYDPRKPHVQLLRYDGRITVGCIAFFDDGRIYAPDNELAQRVIHQMCSYLQWIGNQEATH
jgi:hypothetical protein